MKNSINSTLILFYSKGLSNNVLFRYNIIYFFFLNWNIYRIYTNHMLNKYYLIKYFGVSCSPALNQSNAHCTALAGALYNI